MLVPTMLPVTGGNNCQIYYKNHSIKYRETKHKEFRLKKFLVMKIGV